MPSRKEEQPNADKASGGKKTFWFRRNKTKQQPDDAKKQEDGKREQQLQAYVAWINSHLRKKPGCKLVQDLRRDIADGISLVNLVEVISGEMLTDVDRAPLTQEARKDNTEKVLLYMIGRKIRMHETTAKDIMDGSLKAVMRLILALAAHFKPSTVGKPVPLDGISTHSGVTSSLVYTNPAITPPTRHTRTGYASQYPGYDQSNLFRNYASNGPRHAETFNLADVGYDMPIPSRAVYRQMEPGGGGVKITRAKERFRLIDLDSSVASSMGFGPVNSSPHNGKRLSDCLQWPSPEIRRSIIPSPETRSKGTARKRRTSSKQSPEKFRTRHSHIVKPTQHTPLIPKEPNVPSHFSPFSITFGIEQPTEVSTDKSDFTNGPSDDQNDTIDGLVMSKKKEELEEESGDEFESQDSDAEIMPVLLEQRDVMERELMETKSLLYGLQHLLLSSDAPENAVIPTDEINLKDELTLSLAEGDQLRHKVRSLQTEHEEAERSDDLLRSQNQILQKRLDDQEDMITQLKSDLLRYSLAQQTLGREKQEEKLQDNKSLDGLRSQLISRDNMIDQLQKQLDEATRRIVDLDTTQESLQTQLDKKRAQLKELHSNKDAMPSQRISNHNGSSSPDGFYSDQSRTRTMSESRTTVCSRTPPGIYNDVENIQGQLAGLKMTVSKTNPQQCRAVEGLEHALSLLIDKMDAMGSPNLPRRRYSHRDNEMTKSTRKTRGQSSDSFLVKSSLASTKVVYYTDRAATPFLTSIPKKLGEITLRDFRVAFDRPGSYRFHFKTFDHDVGAVKQEISQEDAIIPGWEGRIIVWVEEDSYV